MAKATEDEAYVMRMFMLGEYKRGQREITKNEMT
jgi:hypothetical protein